MIGDELDRIAVIPDQPDADIQTEGAGGLRIAFLGTSPDVHAINTPVYRAEILPADAKFPPNGLPVFHLTWRNDDGGPGYGADSRLDFVGAGRWRLHSSPQGCSRSRRAGLCVSSDHSRCESRLSTRSGPGES